MATATKRASATGSRGAARPRGNRAPVGRKGAGSAKTQVARRAEAVAKPPGKVARTALKLLVRRAVGAAAGRGRHVLEEKLAAPGAAVRDLAERLREHRTGALAEHVRLLPIQRSIDIAVPVRVAWDEWLQFDFLPEGAHRVEGIERDGEDGLVGRLRGRKVAGEWEAAILDERPEESFAWRSTRGSDCAGLVTFHMLGERLTRLEVELDVIPSRLGEAAALAVHLADRRAHTDLRLFKARLEKINPDDYPPSEDDADEQEEEEE
jgi:uncharacterized membrane protein